uniref:GntR family transcriptional regulator n=1 Tax=Nocardia farcinica TaxID=37329 RepID=UPI002454831D
MAIEVVDAELAAVYDALGSEFAAYERVKQLIVSQIKGGRWRAGDQIPSENQLVSALGLSRMTINRALRDLTAEGVLNRVMGVGTFVAPTKAASPLFEVKNIADEIQQRGHRHRTEVVFVRSEHAEIGHPVLGDALGGNVFHSLIVHFEDDVPIQVEDRYVNPAEAPHYLEQDFTTTTPNTYLSALAPLERGPPLGRARDTPPATPGSPHPPPPHPIPGGPRAPEGAGRAAHHERAAEPDRRAGAGA